MTSAHLSPLRRWSATHVLVAGLFSVSALLGLTGCASAPSAGTPSPPAVSSPGAGSGFLPAPDEARTLQRIGFGSCLHQERPQPILDSILEEDLDLFLFVGDNVYGDVDSPDDLSKLEEAYRLQGESEGLTALRRSTPVLATWDDHDYGVNDAGAEFAGKIGAKRIFMDFWEVPATEDRVRRPGVYEAYSFGPAGQRVQVLLLDTRTFRSPLRPTDARNAPGRERYLPDPDPTKTVLGQAQWKWLDHQLRQPADLRILVSSIQVIADGHGFEAWRLLPSQRERLYKTLRETGAEGVVLLSGDRHRAGLYRQTEALDYPLYELTSSSLNLPIEGRGEEAGPRRLGATYLQENYGILIIDWEKGEVALEVRSLEGEAVISRVVPLEELRAAGSAR